MKAINVIDLPSGKEYAVFIPSTVTVKKEVDGGMVEINLLDRAGNEVRVLLYSMLVPELVEGLSS